MHFNLITVLAGAAVVNAAGLSYGPGAVYGLQYAAFNNPYQRLDSTYSTFDPAYMKAVSAGGQGLTNYYYNSTTTEAGGFTSQGANPSVGYEIYGNNYNIPLYQFAVNHRGYVYAQKTGTYTFTFSNIDDIVYIWTGPTAKTGWTKRNAIATAYWTSADGTGKATASVPLTKGKYLPIRIIYANGGGPFGFNVAVTSPRGQTILSNNSNGNAGVVQFASSGSAAPPFPYTFGNEE